MPDPVDHIARPALPWRDETRTECGKDASKVASVITRDAALAKVKKQGKQRAALSTCMTCWSTAESWRGWDESPSEVLARETKGLRWFNEGPTGQAAKLDAELRAIAALVEAHREEFDGFLTGLGQTVDLVKAREEQRRRELRARLHQGWGTTL
jgi:hypothetical protein